MVIMTISNQNVFANESVEMSAKINVEEISEKVSSSSNTAAASYLLSFLLLMIYTSTFSIISFLNSSVASFY
jgi:hypothetical protein